MGPFLVLGKLGRKHTKCGQCIQSGDEKAVSKVLTPPHPWAPLLSPSHLLSPPNTLTLIKPRP